MPLIGSLVDVSEDTRGTNEAIMSPRFLVRY